MNVDQLYQCKCGEKERLRAINNVPKHAHVCETCYRKLPFDERMHYVTVEMDAFIRGKK